MFFQPQVAWLGQAGKQASLSYQWVISISAQAGLALISVSHLHLCLIWSEKRPRKSYQFTLTLPLSIMEYNAFIKRTYLAGDFLKKRMEGSNNADYPAISQQSNSYLMEDKQLLEQDTRRILSGEFEMIDTSDEAQHMRKNGPYKYCYMFLHICIYKVWLNWKWLPFDFFTKMM